MPPLPVKEKQTDLPPFFRCCSNVIHSLFMCIRQRMFAQLWNLAVSFSFLQQRFTEGCEFSFIDDLLCLCVFAWMLILLMLTVIYVVRKYNHFPIRLHILIPRSALTRSPSDVVLCTRKIVMNPKYFFKNGLIFEEILYKKNKINFFTLLIGHYYYIILTNQH